MEINIEDNFALLFDKNNNIAYKALQELQKESERSDKMYDYMDRLVDMLDSDNSYIRTRGLTPITARQCIKLLPMIAKDKPELKADIVSALQKADISVYADSMQPLVYKDLQNSLAEIAEM